MTFILICGKSNAGKTYVCNKLRDKLISDPTFSGDWVKSEGANVEDFVAYYKKDGKHIAINSPSDNDRCMKQFAKYLDDHRATTGVRPDIIITTIRENDRKEYQMNHMCAMLGAIGNGVQCLENHFSQYIEKKTLVSLRPLSQHAFVLHLERQKEGGTETLTQYLDDSADKVKGMLDFAIAHL